MSKKDKIVIIIGIILILLFSISTFLYNRSIKRISKNINVNINSCDIETESNTHGGFLGDGEFFAKLTCDKIDEEVIKKEWKLLPLPTELQQALDIKQCSGDGCYNAFNRYNIPSDIDGYYYFVDRHSLSNDKSDYTLLNERSSYNFSLGIYDTNNKTLYYYELDT